MLRAVKASSVLGVTSTTVAVVLLIVMAFVAFVIGRMVWRFIRGDEQPEAGGSFGWQLFGRHDRAKKPEDWLKP